MGSTPAAFASRVGEGVGGGCTGDRVDGVSGENVGGVIGAGVTRTEEGVASAAGVGGKVIVIGAAVGGSVIAGVVDGGGVEGAGVAGSGVSAVTGEREGVGVGAVENRWKAGAS